ncbi:unnamed protein product [Microthlaspi erraticum]|uniref:Uncharacterized protein n=1 Tax=Microthlaspi erraticum TaxID=1685480 RepID=A0A6D2JKA0_9BRAS|nr:unnamed protein product [Microthlaspi erraticum]
MIVLNTISSSDAVKSNGTGQIARDAPLRLMKANERLESNGWQLSTTADVGGSGGSGGLTEAFEGSSNREPRDHSFFTGSEDPAVESSHGGGGAAMVPWESETVSRRCVKVQRARRENRARRGRRPTSDQPLRRLDGTLVSGEHDARTYAGEARSENHRIELRRAAAAVPR